jgi:arginase
VSKTIAIIGVPVDLGAGRRGVDMGPSAMRYAGLKGRLERLGYHARDLGDLKVPGIDELEPPEPGEKLRFLHPLADMAYSLARTCSDALASDEFPLIIGGDHSLSIGSVAGVAHAMRARKQRIGLIWVDAHGDFNTHNTTPSGNIHGMSLAALCGLGAAQLVDVIGKGPYLDPKQCVIVGARDLDTDERVLLRKAGVTVFTMHDIDKRGMAETMADALRIASSGTDGVHLSLDLDSLDPIDAPGVGTPVPGGLTYREAHLAMEMAHEHGRIVAMDCVECNPILDLHNKTANVGVEMICSALGQRIF